MIVVAVLASGIGVYGSLFAQPAAKPPVNRPVNWNQPAPPPKLTVVCGMTLVPADPNADRALTRPAPPAAAFTMRAIKPAICKR